MREYPEWNGSIWMTVELAVIVAGLAFCVAAISNWDAVVAKIVEVL